MGGTLLKRRYLLGRLLSALLSSEVSSDREMTKVQGLTVLDDAPLTFVSSLLVVYIINHSFPRSPFGQPFLHAVEK